MKKTLTATAMLLSLGASGASAQTLNLQGSDTLFDMMNDPVTGILANCAGANPNLDYVGGGSSNGENNGRTDIQEVVPMSRFLSQAACDEDPSTVAGCYRHSLDGLSVAAIETAGETCDAIRWTGTLNLPSGGTYNITNWRTVLRIIYGGQTVMPAGLENYNPCTTDAPPSAIRSTVATKDCGGEVRTTLVNTWGNMFVQADGSNCTNGACTALKHAFRRDDVSGTTDVFLELLALPKIGTGANAPFCNGTETQDNDPIRRACDGIGFANGEQVCKPVRTTTPTTTSQGLGVVLPVLVPQSNVNPPYVSASGVLPFCSPNTLGGAFYGDVQMPLGAQCPYGGTPNPTCKWPKRTAANDSFDCIAMRNDVPAGVTAANFDGRSFNTILRNANGVILSYQRRNATTGAIQTLPMASAYYRIHQTRAITGSTLPASTGCAINNETQQLGCLAEASPCSVSYSGLTQILDATTGLDDPNRKSLRLRSVVSGSNVSIAPTVANVRLFTQPTGAGCTGSAALDNGFEDRYPLSRGLWLCTVDGIPGVEGATGWTTPGAQTGDQLNAQGALAACMSTRSVVDNAANGANFIPLDDTGTAPIEFFSCADMGM